MSARAGLVGRAVALARVGRLSLAWSAAAGLLLLAAGCGGKVPASRYYLLETAPPAGRAAAPPAGDAPVVAVPPVQVAPPYDQDRLVYRIGDDDPRARFYPYDRWAVPLDLMLADLVAGALDGAGGRRFVPGRPALPGALALIGHLRRLEEVDRDGVPHVRFVLDLELAGGDEAARGSWRLRSDVPAAPGASVDDLVRLLRDEMIAALGTVRPALAAALQAAGPTP